MARYIDRTHLSGWLMQPKSKPYMNLTELSWFAEFSWFVEQLLQTHQPTVVYENEQWQLIWFEFCTSSAPLLGAGSDNGAGQVMVGRQP